MSESQNIRQTKDMMNYALKFIKGKVLDLGAGQAKYKNIIQQKAEKYITFDVVPGPNIDVVGDALNLPFDKESFDTIICTQVLEHIEKPWIVAKEMGRILKAGGICIVTAPFINPYHPDPHDYFRYTTEGLASLFVNENFEIIENGSYGKTFSVLYSFIRFSFYTPYKKPFRGSWRLNQIMFKFSEFLNRFVKNKTIYDSAYVVARKK
jgi:SAM-dependent methyltransferase